MVRSNPVPVIVPATTICDPVETDQVWLASNRTKTGAPSDNVPALTVKPVPPMASVPEPANEIVVPAKPVPALTVPPAMYAMVPVDKVIE